MFFSSLFFIILQLDSPLLVLLLLDNLGVVLGFLALQDKHNIHTYIFLLFYMFLS
jgi:hypothetical protein